MGGSLKRKRPYQQRCRDGHLIDDEADADERRSNRSWNGGSRDSIQLNFNRMFNRVFNRVKYT